MWGLEIQGPHPGGGAKQAHFSPLMGEYTDRHHARPLVYFRFECKRISDAKAVHIQDVLAIVCHQRGAVFHAQTRLTTQGPALCHRAREASCRCDVASRRSSAPLLCLLACCQRVELCPVMGRTA